MRATIMRPVGYLSRWRWVVGPLRRMVLAAVMLLVALGGPARAQTPGPLQAIAAGDNHALAIGNVSSGSGQLWAWGFNYYGQCGNNRDNQSSVPPTVRVVGPSAEGYFTGAQAIAAGSWHSLALRNDGTVWAWGRGNYGQLGVNSDNQHHYPVEVHGTGNVGHLDGIMGVAAGSDFSLAVKSDGTVYAWGHGDAGQLGVHSNNTHEYPVQVHGPGNVGVLSGITAVAAGDDTSLALKDDGTVWTWGFPEGTSWGTDFNWWPVEVKGPNGAGHLTGVVAIAAGSDFSVALRNDGTVWAWGGNGYGQLGVNSHNTHQYPVQVQGPGDVGFLSGITGIAAGQFHSLAVRNDGTVWAWGRGNHGQLGVHSDNEHDYPVPVHGLNNGQPPDNGLGGIASVAAGDSFSMALNSAGTAVYAWGDNRDQQISSNGLQDRTYPVQVSELPSSSAPGAPVLANVTLSAASFLAGSKTPVMSRAKAPVGTNIGFTLDRAARVQFLFTHRTIGRRVGGRCVAQTNANRDKARCLRTARAAFSRQAHAGRTRLHFEGRLDRERRLSPGFYRLTITATANGKSSKPASLRFTILR